MNMQLSMMTTHHIRDLHYTFIGAFHCTIIVEPMSVRGHTVGAKLLSVHHLRLMLNGQVKCRKEDGFKIALGMPTRKLIL